jgi:hypothetical protein
MIVITRADLVGVTSLIGQQECDGVVLGHGGFVAVVVAIMVLELAVEIVMRVTTRPHADRMSQQAGQVGRKAMGQRRSLVLWMGCANENGRVMGQYIDGPAVTSGPDNLVIQPLDAFHVPRVGKGGVHAFDHAPMIFVSTMLIHRETQTIVVHGPLRLFNNSHRYVRPQCRGQDHRVVANLQSLSFHKVQIGTFAADAAQPRQLLVDPVHVMVVAASIWTMVVRATGVVVKLVIAGYVENMAEPGGLLVQKIP